MSKYISNTFKNYVYPIILEGGEFYYSFAIAFEKMRRRKNVLPEKKTRES
jgi:hypothetical protein